MLRSNMPYERIASLATLALLLFACYEVLRPFVFDLMWAAILCFVTWPLYTRLRAWRLSPNGAAICMVLPIAVLAVPVVLMEAVPPETVSPAEPVRSPADVMVPVPVVEMSPVVVTASPAFTGERVVVFLCQY